MTLTLLEMLIAAKTVKKLFDDKIISINIRSSKSHFEDLKNEPQLENCDVVLVQQTCLGIQEMTDTFKLAKYSSHFNNQGNGKGLALFSDQDLHQC